MFIWIFIILSFFFYASIVYCSIYGSIHKQRSLKDKTNGKPIKVQFSLSSSVSSFCIELITKFLLPNLSDRPSLKMILKYIYLIYNSKLLVKSNNLNIKSFLISFVVILLLNFSIN